jgi:hypothetical protein
MSETEKIKIDELFADLAEKQRAVIARMKKVTLEEARAMTKWIKQESIEKKKRPEEEKQNN